MALCLTFWIMLVRDLWYVWCEERKGKEMSGKEMRGKKGEER